MPAQRQRVDTGNMESMSGSQDGPSTSPPPKKKVKRLAKGLTCSNCRQRKASSESALADIQTRCDGTQPSCKTCEVYKDTCQYDRPPPLTQIVDLAQRLQDAEATIAYMKKQMDGPRDPSSSTAQAPEPETAHDHYVAAPPTSQRENADTPRLPDLWAQNGDRRRPGFQTPVEMDEHLMESDLSVDANGQVGLPDCKAHEQLSYHGPTSSVHQPMRDYASLFPGEEHQAHATKEDVKQMLTANARESRAWEDFAIGNAALRNNVPVAHMLQLLKLHWTWIAPQFCWVHRHSFIRDMTTQGPYFSEFLLIVLCAHASRYQSDKTMRDMLTARAELLLGQEIIKASAVPTAQALLQLSARETAFGRFSQAWMYSGMAFRMVSDLGLQHSHGRLLSLGSLNSEDLEIRRRLFWSCFFWDKTLSLYMGRMPVLLDIPSDHAPELLDVSGETELWVPMYEDASSLPEYRPRPSHAASCFSNSCKLAIIIGDIMQRLYARRSRPSSSETVRDIHARLESWRENTPSHLRYDPNSLPRLSPPPHILTQNLLYYTTLILLHRPFYSSSAHRNICRQAAFDLETLLDLLVRTFGVDHITYLQAYCIYTAASVLVKDVNAGDSTAAKKMGTLLNALHGGMRTCPILSRSIDIIENSLVRQKPTRDRDMLPFVSDVRSVANQRTPPITVNPAQNPSPPWFLDQSIGASTMSDLGLPAFPFLEANNLGQSGVNATLGEADLDLFNMLDCFPENNTDTQGNDLFAWSHT